MCFSKIRGRLHQYVDARCLFPTGRSVTSEDELELLPENPEAIVKLAVEQAKEQPLIFWGESSVYAAAGAWPKDQSLTPIALSIRLNPQKFFDDLLNASNGFYFAEADDNRDLPIMRGTNFRSLHQKGICLFLACKFASKSDFL